MRYTAVDTNTGMVVPMPQPGTPIPSSVKFYYIPRIKCLDCPGKLYTPGPDNTAQNFEVHLRNKTHKEKVEARLQGSGNVA
jgi:SWI/SNF-related matrix-associated actin-dependent regulator of chromatin subfamily B member 1